MEANLHSHLLSFFAYLLIITFLLTYLLADLLTYKFSYLLDFLLACLLAQLPIYLFAYLPNLFAYMLHYLSGWGLVGGCVR